MCQNIMYFPRRTLRTLCSHATAAAAVTTVLPSDMTSLVVCPSKSAPQSNRRRRGGYRSHARSLAPDHPRVSISFRPSAHASNRVSGPLGDVIIAGREADSRRSPYRKRNFRSRYKWQHRPFRHYYRNSDSTRAKPENKNSNNTHPSVVSVHYR